jgi:homoserine O-acetyltransferase
MTVTSGRQSASGAWREGSDPGRRQFANVGPLRLEAGGWLPSVTAAFETWGTLSPTADNAVLVEHALTGDSHVAGPAAPAHPTPGWWDGLVGPGRPLDTDRYFIVASNVLGGCQGTTGPASTDPAGRPWGSRFPFVTIRDQVEVEARLARRLGIAAWRAVIGGSMGGMRVLEWAVTHPTEVRTAIVLACTAYATAEQIAWCQPQLLAIRNDPNFRGGDYYDAVRGPNEGLGIARRIAHVTYRSELELHDRFGRREQNAEARLGGCGRFAVESYLDHHAGKIAGRFDANSYVTLTESMNSHDIGRGRGGTAAAMARFDGELVVASVDSDRLYPARLSEEIASAARGSATLSRVSSTHGHDGFLIEIDQISRLVRAALSSR